MRLSALLARVARSHRHFTRANVSAVGLSLSLLILVVVGAADLRTTSARPAAVPETPASAPAADRGLLPTRRAVLLPSLPPLRALIQAAVLVTSDQSLPDALVRRAVSLAHANASLVVAVGDVDLGHGRTRALAADPVKTRVWTPAATGRATGVWQRAAIGEGVVAHLVAKANAVPLGGTVLVRGRRSAVRLRIGAFATTQLPGVGLVVNRAVGDRLGLRPRTGLILAVPETDPAIVAAVLQHALGGDLLVESVLSDASPDAGWVPPAIGPITSPFGMRIHPITQLPEFHNGIDIGAPLGAPVYAMSAGQVLYAGAASGFGNEIVLSHPGGVSTVYGHVSQILVTSGPVRAGQVIALVGDEGESTGPHLHAEVHVQDQPVDPVAWLKAHGVRFTR
ncbi:MAG: Peptidase [Frankiales bacterium]|nr:Peptidase [Frankiales bacterium]